MKELTIDIDRDRIYKEVAKTTAYAGAKRMNAEDIDVYNRTFISEAEFEMLDRFWNEACLELANSLSSWLGEVDSTYGLVTIHVVDNFNFALEDSLRVAMQSFIINTMLTKWYMIANPALAESCAYDAKDFKSKIAIIMNKRRGVIRRGQSPF